jgi:6-pyruvoyltetrahydropterin/6-carboxytetrahydropterin synthase
MATSPLFITRELEFSAAHRLYLEEFTEEKNFEVFGKCANAYGHGHNYVLQVTVTGTPDPSNHMVIHFTRLNRILDEVVMAPLDHRHMNHDVPFLKGILPTSENVVVALWDRIEAAFASEPFTLYQLRLAASPRNWVDYFGPNPAHLSTRS